MLGNRRLVADTFCEVYDLIQPLVDDTFWDFAQVTIEPGAVYLISRKEFYAHRDRIRHIAEQNIATIIFSNPHEGSWTMIGQIDRLAIQDLVQAGQILLVSGGAMDASYPNLAYDSFLPKVLDYEENLQAQAEYQARWCATRPYQFLFLNGRARPHRRQLLKRLQHVLPQSIWTNLDSAAGAVQILPKQYEYTSYATTRVNSVGYVKQDLFANEWGEIYLTPEPYLATHFSLVTETVFEYPYSFRTEKIAKPLMIGHPFIVAANAGYYRDLHDLGFRTFGHIIDETFDTIEDNQLRLERIAQVVEDLCSQDLEQFSHEAQEVCKYNHEHLATIGTQVRQKFPERFAQYIHERSRV